MTVYENLDLPLSYRGVERKERPAIVAEAFDRFNLVAQKDLYPSQLSRGAAATGYGRAGDRREPEVGLADEPTGNLHSDQGKDIVELFMRLNQNGTAIIQGTHSVRR